MRLTLLLVLIILCCPVFIVGCATTSEKVSLKDYSPSNPEDVVVLYIEPSQRYEIVAFVRALQKVIWEDKESLIQRCREEAAKYGADAILITNIGNESSLPGISCKAKAIKMK